MHLPFRIALLTNSEDGQFIPARPLARTDVLPIASKAVLPYNMVRGRSRRRVMTTLTITAKGQVTLKQELLNHLGVGPGEKIEADKLPDGRIVVRAAAQDGTISDFIGCL